MELIKGKFSLYIIAACCLHFTYIHAGLQQEQNQEHHMIEDHNGDEKSKATDSTFDDISLNDELSKLDRYRYVVIMFCKAMNLELQNEGKSHPAEIDDILQQLENFQPQNYNRYIGMKGFEDQKAQYILFDLAQESLYSYKDVLFKEKRPYATSAHYFRILTWFKVNMKSIIFAATVDAVFKPRDDDTEPKNLEVQLFPNEIAAKKKLENDCLQITTLSELDKYDRTLDEALSLFLQLAQNNGNIDKVEQVAYLIPTLDEYVDQPYCEKMRDALEMILAGIIYDYEKFQTVFQKIPEQILLYINEAFRTRCEIKYERANVEQINLKHLDDVTSIYHLRDTMILYNNAMEKKLLPKIQDEEIMMAILQLENFPIGVEACRQFQTNTLLYLSQKVIRKYHHQILEFYNDPPLDNSLQVYYSRLIIWAYKQISRVNSNEMQLYSTLVVLDTIWKNSKIGKLSGTSLNSQIDQLPDEVATLDDLIDFCAKIQDSTNNINSNLQRAEEELKHHITDIYIDSNDINFEELAENGELTKYKYVVIIFCKAMNSKLSQEGKLPPDEINQVFQQLEIMTFSNKDALVAEDMEDLQKIFQQAEKALYHYKPLLLGVKRPYVTRAQYFRLLLWLKFHTRIEPNQPNQFIEPIIDEILKPREDDTHPKNLEVLFPDAMTKMQNECRRVKTLIQLENYGRTIDEAISLFLQLAQNDGNIDKVEPQVADIITPLDDDTDHEYCEDLRESLETILEALGHNSYKFETEFQKKPEEILLYINEAVHIKFEIQYKRADWEEIDLELVDNSKSAQYIHDVMTLYNQAIEEKLLPAEHDEKTIANILRLENFPISDDKQLNIIETNALLKLSFLIINEYDTRIKNFYNGKERKLDDSLSAYYGRLVRWASRKIRYAHDPNLRTVNVTDALRKIRASPEAGDGKGLPLLDTLDSKSYDEMATLDDLVNFCNTGKLPSSLPPIPTNTANEEKSEISQPESMELE